jgi:F0F1-type ATP synthase membrane subunit b/b'
MHVPPSLTDWEYIGILVVSFLVFWFIFGRLFFAPFIKLLGEREGRLKDLAARTEELLREEKAAVEERERQLAAVRREALSRRENERRRADEEAAHLIEQARADARTELEQVRMGIENQFASAARQIEELARSLAGELAAQVLGRPLNGGGRVSPNN